MLFPESESYSLRCDDRQPEDAKCDIVRRAIVDNTSHTRCPAVVHTQTLTGGRVRICALLYHCHQPQPILARLIPPRIKHIVASTALDKANARIPAHEIAQLARDNIRKFSENIRDNSILQYLWRVDGQFVKNCVRPFRHNLRTDFVDFHFQVIESITQGNCDPFDCVCCSSLRSSLSPAALQKIPGTYIVGSGTCGCCCVNSLHE